MRKRLRMGWFHWSLCTKNRGLMLHHIGLWCLRMFVSVGTCEERNFSRQVEKETDRSRSDAM